MKGLTGRTIIVVALLGLVGAACGSGQKVGSEKLLNFQEQKDAQALGREASATPAPLTVGQTPPPTPAVRQTQPPKPTPIFFDVSLVTDSPFYKPGNCLVMPVGVTLRVTNKDTASERKDGRTFTDKAGSFNSGILKAGQSWTWVFSQPADYDIIDQKVNFAAAVLHIGHGSCGK